MRKLPWIAAGAVLALAGCLVSEEPLLDARNGNAAPIEPGTYQACQYSENEPEPECRQVSVERDETGLYSFLAEEDDAGDSTLTRFRRIARGAWLAQMNGKDDDDYFYFYAEDTRAGFEMTMMWCEDLPESLRAKYVRRGEMEVEDNASSCLVKSLAAAVSAAKAYRRSGGPPRSYRIVYNPASLAEEQEE